MDLKLDDGLKTLFDSGKRKGYLTFAQVNEFLPDDAVNPTSSINSCKCSKSRESS